MMRVLNGKQIRQMNTADVAEWSSGFREITLDLGAGDGRFVRHLAQRDAAIGAIALDLCAANPRAASRAAGGRNALFVVGDALALPQELHGVATRVTIILPWGSLLHGLLAGHPGLLDGLCAASRDTARLEIVLNGGALADDGWTLETGTEQVLAMLRVAGARVDATTAIGRDDLRRWPTTWAKRLAFGRDPRAVHIRARLWHLAAVPSPITHHPSCYTLRLTGTEPVLCERCEPFCSAGRVSAQPHRRANGASPQEGGLVARSGPRAPQI